MKKLAVTLVLIATTVLLPAVVLAADTGGIRPG